MRKILKYSIIIFIFSVLIGFLIGRFAPMIFGKKNVIVENIEGNTIDVGTPKTSIISTATLQEKVSPSATLTLEKNYKDCKHTVIDNAVIPVEMVNMTKEEILKKYKDWELKEFSKDRVYLYKDVYGICGEHFLITSNNNEITVYKLDEDYDKQLYKKTGISTEYLPKNDIEKLEEGIYAYGLSELNSELENFE